MTWEAICERFGDVLASTCDPVEAAEWRAEIQAGCWGPGVVLREVTT